MPRRTAKGFNSRAFYTALLRSVELRGVSLRQVARETGVTPSTLTRMREGRWPDGAGLAALSAWADLNPADFIDTPLQHTGDLLPLEKIAVLIRADPNLTPDAARALEEIIRAAYEGFRHNVQ